ncbi:MAG: thiosulfate oxidation carrier complex protein SoxZ [SAR324 cluster bacterium]|jgi:sulfur-oxidizing protein SoxZ|nr:thiosulfate oxidation carrier complex protein SoxZ [SAR324 cluster bacterium]|tara:strand:- start:1212 stop:1520 length:309 start_codon:yes stop_codon:yes gene_type:complete
MAKSIRIKAKEKKGIVTVKALIKHPMETGLRKDIDGNLVPAHYITEVIVTANGELVMTTHWGTSVSKNPYINFQYEGSKGDKIRLEYADNLNQKASIDTVVK